MSEDYIITMTLYGGPLDGEETEIHQDTLKIKPRISFKDEKTGEWIEYALDNEGKFVWLPDPDSPKVARGFFICDDDGNVITEVNSEEEALDALDKLDKDD